MKILDKLKFIRNRLKCVPGNISFNVLKYKVKHPGPCRDRTYDQLIKSQLLYQLS